MNDDIIRKLRVFAYSGSAGKFLADDAADEIEQLRDRVRMLEVDFGHYHVNNDKDDGCAKCGRDLRDSVHFRFLQVGDKGNE